MLEYAPPAPPPALLLPPAVPPDVPPPPKEERRICEVASSQLAGPDCLRAEVVLPLLAPACMLPPSDPALAPAETLPDGPPSPIPGGTVRAEVRLGGRMYAPAPVPAPAPTPPADEAEAEIEEEGRPLMPGETAGAACTSGRPVERKTLCDPSPPGVADEEGAAPKGPALTPAPAADARRGFCTCRCGEPCPCPGPEACPGPSSLHRAADAPRTTAGASCGEKALPLPLLLLL